MSDSKKDWISLGISVLIMIVINTIASAHLYLFVGWGYFYSIMASVGMFFLVRRVWDIVELFRDDAYQMKHGHMIKVQGKRYPSMEEALADQENWKATK